VHNLENQEVLYLKIVDFYSSSTYEKVVPTVYLY
jgi:hypothetical protein